MVSESEQNTRENICDWRHHTVCLTNRSSLFGSGEKKTSSLFGSILRYLSTSFFWTDRFWVLFVWSWFFFFWKMPSEDATVISKSTRVIESTIIDSRNLQITIVKFDDSNYLEWACCARCLFEEAVSWNMWVVELVNPRQMIRNMISGNERIWWLGRGTKFYAIWISRVLFYSWTQPKRCGIWWQKHTHIRQILLECMSCMEQ